jgi:hypothetical protein
VPRSQFSSARERSAIFLNRSSELRVVRGHVELLREDPRHLRVFEVVGLGGVGKTRLLNELWRTASEGHRPQQLLWIPLEAEASATETGPLRAIREQLGFDCLLFDTALLTYWSGIGQPFQVERGGRLASSLAVKTAEVGSTLAGLALPLSFAVDVYRAVGRRLTRVRHYQQEEFEAIDDLRRQPGALRARLPHYLGLDLVRRLEPAGQSLVAFYDAYDKQSPATVAGGAPWLREFIGTLDRGVHVISSRERLRWTPDWEPVTERVAVGSLPEVEARELVRARLGSVPPAVEGRLLTASRRIPFFLEAAAAAYESRAAGGRTVDPDDLPSSPDDAVAYLLDHLTLERRRIAVALAAVQFFDAATYAHLLRALHLAGSVPDFDDFVAWFFVEQAGPGLYKTHDLLTAFVRASVADDATRRAALEAAADHLRARIHVDGVQAADTVLPLLGAAIAGWAASEEMPTRSAEALVDAAYRFYDAGYWNELGAISPTRGDRDDHPGAPIAEMFAALAARRTTGVERALELFERLEPRAGALGRHERSVALEVAYLAELAGNYGKAREDFRRLAERSTPFDPTDRLHLRARLYHADMLIMDGAFTEGSRLLLETYEQVGHRSPVDWAELVRHRAHAFRFSLLTEEAEDLYAQALRSAADAPALVGKLHTNLAEAWCWGDPPRAMEAAALSSEMNLRLGNRIELVKCDAARAIALARLGEPTAAHDAGARATQLARQVGYPAGVAFALQASAVADGLAGDPERLAARRSSLGRTLDALGTYFHLAVAPAWLAGAEPPPDARAVDWLAPQEVELRLRSHLGARGSAEPRP